MAPAWAFLLLVGLTTAAYAEIMTEIVLKSLESEQTFPIAHEEDDGLLVGTLSGVVKGFNSISSRNKTPFYSFQGIPFAKPPIGELRFRDPQPVDPWKGIFNATSEALECTNMLAPGRGVEDCLYLNVYTPKLPKDGDSPKAVLVVVHGGGFIGGTSDSSIHSPDFYMDQDIIFVTFNYRVGILGFLSLQNEEVPGNAGLKDQRLVLQWVQNNIELFGGDRSMVTLAGQSAGSASTAFNILSDSTTGLFHRAIMQSATALTPWTFTWPDEAEKKAFQIGLLLGCVEADVEQDKTKLLTCLQERSDDAIVIRQELALTAEEIRTLRPFAFIPTIEPPVEGAFLTASPIEKLEARNFNKVPTIIGANSNEGLLLLKPFRDYDEQDKVIELVTADMTRWVPYTLNVTKDSPYAEEISSRIKQFYFTNEIPSHEEAIYMITILQFILQIQEFAKLVSENSDMPVYNYLFTYDGPFSANKPFNNISDAFGVAHGDELGYLTNVERVRPAYGGHLNRSSIAERMIDRMTGMWTNFVKTGDPTPEITAVLPTKWEPFSGPEHMYLLIDEELSLMNGLLSDHTKFWNDIYELVDGRRPLPE